MVLQSIQGFLYHLHSAHCNQSHDYSDGGMGEFSYVIGLEPLAIRVHRSWLNALHRLELVHNHCTASTFYIGLVSV